MHTFLIQIYVHINLCKGRYGAKTIFLAQQLPFPARRAAAWCYDIFSACEFS